MEFELSVKFNICKDFFYIVLVQEKVRKSLSRITKVVLGSSLLGFKAAKDLWAREAGYLVKILTLFFQYAGILHSLLLRRQGSFSFYCI